MANLVLTGFMGTGKTSVGRRVAELLGREFIDTDQWIVTREGKSISVIFDEHGEIYFRERERAACAEAGRYVNAVIATGGKALIDPINRAQFDGATIICLNASADEILARLERTGDERPLLLGNRREVVEKLLEERRVAYAEIPIQIDTNGKTIEEVAREVVAIVGAHPERSPEPRRRAQSKHLILSGAPAQSKEAVPLRVRTPNDSYPIHLERGLIDQVGEILRASAAQFASRCAVVTNPIVGNLYAARVLASLRAGGFDPVVIEIPDGEQYKTLDSVRYLYDQLVEARLERHSPVFALGGGVIGDLAGFAAATYLRGVPFAPIPTTLLAMVDASIGGKVAVDHPAGKNLTGAFKFPHAVIADPATLDSLPIEEFRAGMAEVIKHAIIGDALLFEDLEQGARRGDCALRALPVAPTELIARALRVKIDIVERDPFEENIRAHLNLGHTFAHALEVLSGYQLRHGYAVAMGIAIASRLAARIGYCDVITRDRIIALLEIHSLPTRVPSEFSAREIFDAMRADKKIRGGKLRLILPREIGCVEIVENVSDEEISRTIEESRQPI